MFPRVFCHWPAREIEAGNPTVSAGGQTTPRTEAGDPTTRTSSQTIDEIEAGSPTATPGGQTTMPFAAPSSPTLPTSAAPRMAPTTPPVAPAS
jgi:hypothetical protein